MQIDLTREETTFLFRAISSRIKLVGKRSEKQLAATKGDTTKYDALANLVSTELEQQIGTDLVVKLMAASDPSLGAS